MSELKHYLGYMHAGSGNHGCEAIVKSLAGLLSVGEGAGNLTVLSNDASEDKQYGLNKVCTLLDEKKIDQHFLAHVWYYGLRKLTGKGELFLKYRYQGAWPLSNYDLAISIGGDNYCYDMMVGDLILANSMFRQNGLKTVLLGCSIEPELLQDDKLIKDMQGYSLIIARESITYGALTKAGLTNAVLLPDPAFSLETEYQKLPEGFAKGHTIGLNVSPMILDNENGDRKGITLLCYERLIQYLMEHTEDQIALIPHVVWDRNDDRKPILILFEKFRDTGRVILLPDGPASVQKGYIARCRLFIGARTHATIAAYSSMVPTLVVGYSVKARGIAKDLFGTDQGYVLPVQSLKEEDDLILAYRWLEEHAEQQQAILQEIMPGYVKQTEQISVCLKQVLEQ